MAPPTLVPDKNTLMRWHEEGLTHAAMADRVFEETGNRVTRTAIRDSSTSAGSSRTTVALPRFAGRRSTSTKTTFGNKT